MSTILTISTMSTKSTLSNMSTMSIMSNMSHMSDISEMLQMSLWSIACATYTASRLPVHITPCLRFLLLQKYQENLITEPDIR